MSRWTVVCQPGMVKRGKHDFFWGEITDHLQCQTASNACASVALLNIVNNIPDVDLGENLQQFKEFTMPFTPALRGDAINNFEFVKRVHNSFARYAKHRLHTT